jgi:hypothetical protein
MSIELICNVENMKDSYIPDIKIMEMNCENNVKIKMDIHRRVNIFKVGDSILFTISKTTPQYNEGKDFVAHGYIISKRIEGNNLAMYVSLWGFLIILALQNSEKIADFNTMDKVYVKISHI